MTALPPRVHAELAPSSAHRWLPCPGSLQFMSEGPESVYAEEGQYAHAVLEAVLKGQQVLAGDVIAGRPASVERIQQAIEVRDYLRQWHQTHPDWNLESETRVEVGAHAWGLAPGIIAGTTDAVMYAKQEAVVLDAKFGFVRVEPKDNPQLYLYAAGLVGELYDLFGEPIKFVTLIIAQPNYEGVMDFREHRLPAEDIWRWCAINWPRVERALARDLKLDASDERACRYCPGRANCTARTEQLVKLAQEDWRNAHTLEDLLPLVAQVRHICDDLEHEAARRLREGQDVKGFKLVESRSIRKWPGTQEDGTHWNIAANAAFLGNQDRPSEKNWTETDFYEKKLLSPAKMEKLLTKKVFAKLPTPPVTPRGRPKLALESDPRPPISLDEFSQEDVDASQLDE